MDYVQAIDPAICNGLGYLRMVGLNLVRRTDSGTIPVSIAVGATGADGGTESMSNMSSMSGSRLASYPQGPRTASSPPTVRRTTTLGRCLPKDETDLVW